MQLDVFILGPEQLCLFHYTEKILILSYII